MYLYVLSMKRVAAATVCEDRNFTFSVALLAIIVKKDLTVKPRTFVPNIVEVLMNKITL